MLVMSGLGTAISPYMTGSLAEALVKAGHDLYRRNFITDGCKPVKGGKGISEEHGVLPLPAHKNALPGNKHIIEYDHGLGQLPDRIIRVKFVLCPGPPPPSADENNPFRVGRNGKADRIIRLILPHLTGRDHDNLVGHRRAGDV